MMYMTDSDSESFFSPSGLAINQEVYEMKCLSLFLFRLFKIIIGMLILYFGRTKYRLIMRKRHKEFLSNNSIQ